MVSQENTVIGISILLALVVGAAIYQFTSLPSWVGMAAFIVVGVLVPTAINEYTR